ncbi:hypothetical protein LG634_30050 [Streptomyces bambusae]|uniref:hypothetical protein n=1 Tax=Streptomyces bambusae TaxID=1550616 RepID=UPI001CFCBE70|nr:hypothetical protein [Streptomyces bambusae]MCB5169043.1 hypothetical protein [Streptomyces bambusae]
MNRTCLRALAAGFALAAALSTGTGPATAAVDKDGILDPGEFGLYCLQNQGGAVFDMYTADANFRDNYFKGTLACARHTTDDYTESYLNRDTATWSVYTEAYRGGYAGWLPGGYRGNASTLFRNTITSAYLEP